jgi:predicted NBD/HSP70 family sugar kinase
MARRQARHILVIDIGGGHVKFRVSNRRSVAQFPSGPSLTPRQMVKQVLKRAQGWRYEGVTVGFPGMVIDGCIVCEPANLSQGWIGFDFAKAFGRPTRIMNDAVMQALGSYTGGRMLFLGFGTGLGAVLIAHSKIYPMELAHLPFTKRGLIQNYVGDEARRRLGGKRWSMNAKNIIKQLSRALNVHSVVVGGGNACRLGRLSRSVRRGDNDLAFVGGLRLWQGNWEA